MSNRYDPQQAPDPQEWTALDESERIELALHYHKQARIRLPNARLHATIHAIVEGQFALADKTPVAATVERLMKEGLDRHDAIHAVGTALADFLWAAGRSRPVDPTARYYEEVKKLTAQGWLDSADE
jgi:hypothetical protein